MMRTTNALVLHVGLPKTGSTALQHWCFNNRATLLARGIDYPDAIVSTDDPKHQFVVEAIRTGNLQTVASVLAQPRSSATLVLSAEGLTNQFRYFAPTHLTNFRKLLAGWHVTVFVVRREQAAWTRSYYRQCLINPPFSGHAYGTGLGLKAFAALDEVQALYALGETPRAVGEAFGADLVAVADYEKDWLAAWLRILGMPADDAPALPSRANDSPPETVMEAILAINQRGVSLAARSSLLNALARATATRNTVLRDYYHPAFEPAVIEEALDTLKALQTEGVLDDALLEAAAGLIRQDSEAS